MLKKQIICINQLEKLKKCSGIVLVGGCFDVLHLGHITFLEKAKKYGKELVILLESDESIKKYKGNNRPINRQKDRAKMLTKLKIVDWVIELPELKTNDEYQELIKKIKPKIIAITEGDERTEIKKNEAKKAGAELVLVTKRIGEYSTSKIVDVSRDDTITSNESD